MHISFVTRDNGPERLVTEAEIVFGEGPLADMKLVGLSVWRGADGDLYVTFPSRAFGVGYAGDPFVPAIDQRAWNLLDLDRIDLNQLMRRIQHELDGAASFSLGA